MNRFKSYVKMPLLMLVMMVALSMVASAAAPGFVSATATSDTNIDIEFDQTISIVGTPVWATAVTATDMIATGGSADGSTLHVTVNPLGDTAYAAIDLAIAGNTVKNIVNDPNAPIADKTIDDGQAPTVTITSTATNPTGISPIPMTATFSEDVFGFVEGGIGVTNGVITDFDGSLSEYIFNVVPAIDGAVTVDIDALVAEDDSGNGNTAAAQFSITYDVTSPIITLVGTSPIDVEFGSVYTDAGATALDNVDGYINGSIVPVNTVNTSVLGTYTVTYDVTDAAGNPADQVTRTVNVVQATPVITWDNPANITYGTALSGTQLNAVEASSIPGTFVYTPASGTVLGVGADQTLHVDFTPEDPITYTTASKDVTINVVDILLHLNKGWNLVSVPRKLDNNSVSALDTTMVNTIHYFDTGSGEWKSAFYTSGNWSGDLKEIKDGKGYWMNATEATEVPVVLKPLDQETTMPDYPLKAGWNMVGYTSLSLNLNTSVPNYFYSLRDLNTGFPIWVSAYRWTGSGYEQTKPTGGFPNVVRTEGYWLYLKSDGTLVP